MKLFSTQGAYHPIRFHATQTEAKKWARDLVNGDAAEGKKDSTIEVTEHVVVAGKDGIVALANSCEGAFTSEEVLCTIKARKSSKPKVDSDANPWD